MTAMENGVRSSSPHDQGDAEKGPDPSFAVHDVDAHRDREGNQPNMSAVMPSYQPMDSS